MARSSIPHALAMRELKYGEAPDGQREAVARALLEAERLAEAWLLFERRPDHALVSEMHREALRRGQTFLLLSMRRAGRPVSDEDLRAAAATAESAGRWLDARHAWAAVGADSEIARIAEHLPPRLRPAAEDTGASDDPRVPRP